jgi:D-alanyl-D-alanine carboxypeptidase
LSECDSERIQIGEEISIRNLLTAMLIDSANDAAIALAKHVAGSQDDFAKMMNAKATEIGLEDSHFCNPTGLDASNCYSSAYDLARITAYSMKYDFLWKLMNTEQATVSSIDKAHVHKLKNTDTLLGKVPNCLGGKTGFTYGAGKSLMMAASDPGTERHRVIAVILNDENRWEDMPRLINWAFENFEWN